MNKKILLLLVNFAPFSAAITAENYYCTSDKNIGFAFNTIEWQQTSFKAEKFVISSTNDGYELKSSGQKESLAKCYTPEKSEVIICNGWVNVHFSPTTGRYTSMHVGSYHLVGTEFFPTDEPSVPNPSVSIGTCIEI
jgi:hypothetical protein